MSAATSSGVSTCRRRWLIIPTATFFGSFPLYGAKAGSSVWPFSFDSIVHTSALSRLR
jgi:hypothetical protein